MARLHHLPTSGTAAESLQLRIQPQGLEPAIWRRVRVPANITLGRLHRVIQAAMGWTDSHLHEYIIDGQRYGQPDPDWDLPHQITPEARVKLDAALAGRKTFIYLYDFGDDWEHQIKVEKVLPAETLLHPVCEAGEHACPPEDVGGVPGYVWTSFRPSPILTTRSIRRCWNGAAAPSTLMSSTSPAPIET